MMDYQVSVMANPLFPFYMLPIFYEGLHNIASYPMSIGCWIQCFIVSLAFPSVYFKSRTNLPCGSSILYCTTSLNTAMK